MTTGRLGNECERLPALRVFPAGWKTGVPLGGAGGRREEVWVASGSALDHPSDMSTEGEIMGVEGGDAGALTASAFSLRPLRSRFPRRRVELWGDPFGFQAWVSRALYTLFSWKDFFLWHSHGRPPQSSNVTPPLSSPDLCSRSGSFPGTAPMEPPVPLSLPLP